MMYAVELDSGSMICIPSFMITYYLDRVRSFCVGSHEGRDL
jgi:hypothetical protein